MKKELSSVRIRNIYILKTMRLYSVSYMSFTSWEAPAEEHKPRPPHFYWPLRHGGPDL